MAPRNQALPHSIQLFGYMWVHLAHVPVLEEPLFRHMGLLEVDAELQVAEHDLLDQLFAGTLHVTRANIFRVNMVGLPVGVVPLLALDNIIESVQGSAWFTNLHICD